MTPNSQLFATHVIIVTVVLLGPASASGPVEHNGFGSDYSWVDLDTGFQEAKAQNKPLLLIIHKSWCGACRALKPEFAESTEILDLSKEFIMVNLMDEDEPKPKEGEESDRYSPDGSYIPRILFFDPNGTILREIVNEDGNDQYKYYYYGPGGIVKSMVKVLEALKSSRAGADGEETGKTEL